MAKFSQGIYRPTNLSKYIGATLPTYRSSWEKKVFIWLDKQPNVTKWASEPIKIPYLNPITGKVNNYVPDLLIEYVDRNNTKHVELIEIKPLNQSLEEMAVGKKDKIAAIVNKSKWESATAWCHKQGISFRVLTEFDIFGKPRTKKPKKRK